MKEVFKKALSRAVLEPIVIFIVSMLTLEFIVYPGLTIDNTILNILSGALGVFLALSVLAYVDGKIRDKFEKKDIELTEEQREKIINELKEKGLYQEPTKSKKNKKNKKDGVL
jgi:hypothetical protein